MQYYNINRNVAVEHHSKQLTVLTVYASVYYSTNTSIKVQAGVGGILKPILGRYRLHMRYVITCKGQGASRYYHASITTSRYFFSNNANIFRKPHLRMLPYASLILHSNTRSYRALALGILCQCVLNILGQISNQKVA